MDIFNILMGFHIDTHYILFLQGLYREEGRLVYYVQDRYKEYFER